MAEGLEEKDPADVLHRFSFVDLPIRGQWVRLDRVLDGAFAAHAYPGPVRELLAQMFAAVAMFADNLKFTGTVALQSQGPGALRRSLAECREHAYLRGIAHVDAERHAQEPQLNDRVDLTAWLDGGRLALTLIPPRDSSQQQTSYQGLIDLEHPTLAACLERYFETSEQLPTRLFFATRFTPDGAVTGTGLLLQRLPNEDGATEIASQTYDEAWHTIETLAATLTADELAALGPEPLLRRLFAEYPCRLYPSRQLSFKCTCTRAKTDQTLRILPEHELTELLEERGRIDVNCEFCGTNYGYDKLDVTALLKSGGSEPGATVH